VAADLKIACLVSEKNLIRHCIHTNPSFSVALMSRWDTHLKSAPGATKSYLVLLLHSLWALASVGEAQ